jgi:hypothetical protein
MTEQKHEQPESDAENPSLTDGELEQVAGGVGTKYCMTHGANAPCQSIPACKFTIVP